jgi:hypothetical protein
MTIKEIKNEPEIRPRLRIFSPAYPAMCDPKLCPIKWTSEAFTPSFAYHNQFQVKKGNKTTLC